MTTSARSTSSRSSSSRRISERSRSKGPAKTSRSSSSWAMRTPGRLGGASDGLADAHRLAHVRDDRRGDRLGLGGADLEDLLDRGGVLAQLEVALPHGRQPRRDLLAHGGLEVPVALALETALDGTRIIAPYHGEDLDQVRDAGLVVGAHDLTARVGLRALELLDDARGLLVHIDRAPGRAAGGRHLLLGLLEVAHAGADRGDVALGDDQRLAEALVEVLRDVAHQLDVLALVLTHRHLVRAVGEHVGGH